MFSKDTLAYLASSKKLIMYLSTYSKDSIEMRNDNRAIMDEAASLINDLPTIPEGHKLNSIEVRIEPIADDKFKGLFTILVKAFYEPL